jgi:hypothetical protein
MTIMVFPFFSAYFLFLLRRKHFFRLNGAASPGMDQSPLGMNLGVKKGATPDLWGPPLDERRLVAFGADAI